MGWKFLEYIFMYKLLVNQEIPAKFHTRNLLESSDLENYETLAWNQGSCGLQVDAVGWKSEVYF